MSCGHGWHSCGPWYGPPRGEGWYGPDDWYEEIGRPMRHRGRRYVRSDAGGAADDLETRLATLREEIRRAETELAELRGRADARAERP